MASPRLLTHVGGQPVGLEYTLIHGTDPTAVPDGLAVVWRAEQLAATWIVVEIGQREIEAFQSRGALSREAERARARAGVGRPDAERWRAEAESLEELLAAEGFDEQHFVRMAVAGDRARDRLSAIAGRPLIVLGDHPDLGDALDQALDAHPQVVHLPEA